MPKRPRPAEEELQRGRRSAGLPGVGEREEWASGRGEAAPGRLPHPPPPGPAPLRAGEDVPRGVQVAETGAAAARQRCEELREEGAGYTDGGPSTPPPVYPQALGPATGPTDDLPADHPLTVSKAVSVPARFRNVRTLGRLRKL